MAKSSYFHFMIRLFWVSMVITKALVSFGQSEPQFTQYFYNRYLFNPAYSGSSDALEICALYRGQYMQLAPKVVSSQALNINAPIYNIKSALGLNVINDLIGYQRSTYLTVNYAYRKSFKWGNMALGIGVGFIQTALDGAKLLAPDGNYDGEITHNDNSIPLRRDKGIAPDLSFGLYLSDKNYFAGVSINHIAFSSSRLSSSSTMLNFSRNIFFMGGYNLVINRKLNVQPSVFLKSDFKKVQMDLTAMFTVIDNILIGLSFRGYTKRAIDALAMNAGFKYKGVQVVYSYDANLSYLSNFNGGSHEISLSYRFALKSKEKRFYLYHNPRYN